MQPKPNIHPDLLRTFVTVVECGSFSKAAERLLRGQSAISLQVKRLEQSLGAKLLDRSPRHLALTNEGELLLDDARRLLSLNDALVARFDEAELSGVVRLGAPEDFATSHLPNVLARFARSYPQVALEITCELTMEVLKRFNASRLDIALVKREPAATTGGIRVWREPLVWVAADPLIADAQATLPLVVSPRPCVYRQRATHALDGIGRPWRIVYTCRSLAGAHAAVRAGLGATVLPKEMVPAELTILNDEASGLPDLADTEMALIERPNLSSAATRLRDYIIRELEHTGG